MGYGSMFAAAKAAKEKSESIKRMEQERERERTAAMTARRDYLAGLAHKAADVLAAYAEIDGLDGFEAVKSIVDRYADREDTGGNVSRAFNIGSETSDNPDALDMIYLLTPNIPVVGFAIVLGEPDEEGNPSGIFAEITADEITQDACPNRATDLMDLVFRCGDAEALDMFCKAVEAFVTEFESAMLAATKAITDRAEKLENGELEIPVSAPGEKTMADIANGDTNVPSIPVPPESAVSSDTDSDGQSGAAGEPDSMTANTDTDEDLQEHDVSIHPGPLPTTVEPEISVSEDQEIVVPPESAATSGFLAKQAEIIHVDGNGDTLFGDDTDPFQDSPAEPSGETVPDSVSESVSEPESQDEVPESEPAEIGFLDTAEEGGEATLNLVGTAAESMDFQSSAEAPGTESVSSDDTASDDASLSQDVATLSQDVEPSSQDSVVQSSDTPELEPPAQTVQAQEDAGRGARALAALQAAIKRQESIKIKPDLAQETVDKALAPVRRENQEAMSQEAFSPEIAKNDSDEIWTDLHKHDATEPVVTPAAPTQIPTEPELPVETPGFIRNVISLERTRYGAIVTVPDVMVDAKSKIQPRAAIWFTVGTSADSTRLYYTVDRKKDFRMKGDVDEIHIYNGSHYRMYETKENVTGEELIGMYQSMLDYYAKVL